MNAFSNNRSSSSSSSKTSRQPKSKSLGAWFPTATTRKVPSLILNATTDQKCSICLFYHYVRPAPMSIARTERLKVFLDSLTHKLQIGGRIRYAQEGLNCTLSSSRENLRSFSKQLVSFGPEFKDTDFKFIDDLPHDRSFKDLKLLPVKELVFYGVGEDSAPLAKGGIHLKPKEYHQKMQEKETVIIDVRNSYEAEIGRFVGQEKEGGAVYIDPKMRKSTDFKGWLDKPETQETLKGKQVLLYCTGGVRCERASALINHQIGKDIKGVYQLHGGVERYMQEFPEGGYWEGFNYVFDKREGVGIGGTAGVGGVVQGKKKKKKKKAKKSKNKNKNNAQDEEENNGVLGKCCTCNVSWERYVGKKKCYTCGVPVLMCDSCMSIKIDKIQGRELEVRCPLCKEENITVPASQTTYIDNGEGARPMNSRTEDGSVSGGSGKAASSVMKWGGGSQWGSKKRAKRVEETAKNLKRKANDKLNGTNFSKPCRFGDACNRKDCWFSHPKDGGGKSGGDSSSSSSSSSSNESSNKKQKIVKPHWRDAPKAKGTVVLNKKTTFEDLE